MHSRRRRIVLVVKLTVAVVVIAWLVKSGKIDFNEIKKVGGGWPWLAASLVPFGLVLGLCSIRWKCLLSAQDIDYSMRDAFALTMVGHFFNQFLLGTTGGDVVKAYAIATEHRANKGAAVMSVFVDRIVGLLVLVGVALLAIPFNLERILGHSYLQFLAALTGFVFLASLVGGYAFFSDRVRSHGLVRSIVRQLPLPVRGIVGKLTNAVYIYKFHRRVMLMAVLSSLLVHLLIVVMHLLLAQSLGAQGFSWGAFFFLIPLAQIAMAIPLNPPGAIGTGEWIYATLLPLAGIPGNQGALICILQRVVYYFWALLGCVYYVRRRRSLDQAIEEAEADDERTANGGDSEANRPGGVGHPPQPSNGDRNLRARIDSNAL